MKAKLLLLQAKKKCDWVVPQSWIILFFVSIRVLLSNQTVLLPCMYMYKLYLYFFIVDFGSPQVDKRPNQESRTQNPTRVVKLCFSHDSLSFSVYVFNDWRCLFSFVASRWRLVNGWHLCCKSCVIHAMDTQTSPSLLLFLFCFLTLVVQVLMSTVVVSWVRFCIEIDGHIWESNYA